MAKEKNIKTNAMRILEKKKIPFKANFYSCEEFIDGIHIADMLSQSYDMSFKTLVAVGKSKENYVFVLPIDKELDLKKAAKVSSNKKIEMLPLKELLPNTGYIRGGCSPIGMKKKLPTYIDVSALDFEKITVSGGARGLQLLLNPDDLIKFTDALCEDITKD